MPRWYLASLAGLSALTLGMAMPSRLQAQEPGITWSANSFNAVWGARSVDQNTATVHPAVNIGQYFYYPYHYFPHSYWPQQGPQWPEPPGAPYMRPPAYMAYPPFKEPHWRYHWYEPKRFYRGFHFWLDQF